MVQKTFKFKIYYIHITFFCCFKEKCKKCRRVKNQESKPKEIYHEGNHLTVSQSLPNIWPPKKNSTVANRNCLSIEAR